MLTSLRRSRLVLLAAALVLTSCSSGGGDEPTAASSTTTLPLLLTPEQCAEAAAEAVQPLQAFIDEYSELTVEEWNALDPPPDLEQTQQEVVAIAQAAVDKGCLAETMETMLADGVNQLDGNGEVGSAIAASLRGDGPFLGPPAPVATTTIPQNIIPTTVTLEVGESLPILMAQIAPGSTVRFAAGRHRFSEPILVDKDITFEGAGQQETTLSSTAGGVALAFVGPGGFTMRDLTLEHTGSDEASVMVVIEGPVHIENVTIGGGVAGPESAGGGHGIVYAYEDLPGFPERSDIERRGALTVVNTTVAGNAAAGVLINGAASPEFDRVTIADNGSAGALVTGTADPVFDNATVTGNGGCGICFTGDSAGTVTDAVIEANEIGVQIGDTAAPEFTRTRFFGSTNVGISIDGESNPVISESTIEENGNVGVQIAGSATPTIDQNTIRQHGVGILVADRARPTLTTNGIVDHEIGVQVGGQAVVETVDNVVWLTTGAAISYTEFSSGSVRDNQIDRATGVGIQTLGDASTQLVDNVVENAGSVGISYVERSSGTATGNTVTGRDVGVQIGGTASADLFDNTISDIVTVGVLFGDASSGKVQGNRITRAEAAALLAGGTAKPSIEGNTITDNAVGFVLREKTTALVTGNTLDVHGVSLQVFDDATPTVTGNTITASADAGVVYGGSAGGSFERNRLEENGNVSIQVGENASPLIADNEIRGQGVYGAVYRDTSGGVFRDNLVINLVFAVQLNDSAAPALFDNSLEEIALTNISYADSSAGEARGNSCAQSFGAGITIAPTASPNVGDNDCTVSRAG